MLNKYQDILSLDDSNITLIRSLFSNYIKLQGDSSISILPSSYKFIQILDKEKLGYQLYIAIKTVLKDSTELEKYFEVKRKNLFFFRNMTEDGIVFFNKNELAQYVVNLKKK